MTLVSREELAEEAKGLSDEDLSLAVDAHQDTVEMIDRLIEQKEREVSDLRAALDASRDRRRVYTDEHQHRKTQRSS